MSAGVDRLIDELRGVEAPEALYPLAAQAHSLTATSAAPGALLIAHTVLTAPARKIEVDALDKQNWRTIQSILGGLADLLILRSMNALDVIGRYYVRLSKPSALQ